jgi:hypothetical protein
MLLYTIKNVKRYRKIRKTDKLPNLPRGSKAIYYLKEDARILIWVESNTKRYTIEWDGISTNPTWVHWAEKQPSCI